jgi:hypothetical protein
VALLWCVGGGARRAGAIAARGGAVVGVAAAVAGWWYLRNLQLYGDPLGLAAFKAEFTTQPFNAGDPGAWIGALGQLFASYWGRFGWMNVAPPEWATWLYALVSAGTIAGVLIALRRGAGPRPIWPLLALPALALAWVVAFAFTAGLVAWQGRLIFAALPALALLIGAGVVQIARPAAQGALVAALAAGAAWMPFGVIAPAYPQHALSEAAAQARIERATFARFARYTELGIEVRGWSMHGEPRPGETLEVRLVWHALSRQNRDWQVFVQILDGRELIVEDMREPAGGAFPTLQWVAGDWVETRHLLTLPADLPPGNYTLKIGLADPGERLRAAYFNDYDVKDPEGDSYDLAILDISE